MILASRPDKFFDVEVFCSRRYSRRTMKPRTIGIVYDLIGTHPRSFEDPPDIDAEYEPQATVDALASALRKLGCEVRLLGKPHDLLAQAAGLRAASSRFGDFPSVEDAECCVATSLRLDAVLTIAEGYGTRNREAWAPVLLEMLGIPALGSDALTLSLSLDKAWTKAVMRAAGIATPAYVVLHSPAEALQCELPAAFPLFVKPRWEGTAKGIEPGSRVSTREELVKQVERVVQRYRQPALVEAFLDGAEYTVTVVGNDPPRALAVLQRALEATTRIGLHALEPHAPQAGWAYLTPGELDASLENELQALALRAYVALECRDFARVDFRLDRLGQPQFLEINPLPTFAPDGSFAILAELMGKTYEDLLAEVLYTGLRRLKIA